MELLEQAPKIAAYVPIHAELVQLEADNAAITFDYASKQGNKDARSHVHKLRLSKGALERARKAVKADVLARGKAIDAEAQALEARIEAMIEVHQAPLDRIEQAEKERIAALETRVAAIRNIGAECSTSVQALAAVDFLEATMVDESFAEYMAEAVSVKASQLDKLRALAATLKKSEDEAAELARLRAESEARAKADRDAQIAREAEERAKAQLEAQAQAEREAAAKREADLKSQAERAEADKLAAEQRAINAAAQAERDRVAAEARAAQQAADAVRAEQERVEQKKREAAAEQARREADKEHRRAINQQVLAAMVKGGIAEACAKDCIKLIASGVVPNVAIQY